MKPKLTPEQIEAAVARAITSSALGAAGLAEPSEAGAAVAKPGEVAGSGDVAEAGKPGTSVVKRLKVKWPEVNKDGFPLKHSMMNTRKAISALRLDCKFDVFHDICQVNGTDMQSFVGELSDKVVRKFRELSFTHLGLDPGSEAARDGLMRACEHHMYDPIRDYLNSLKWDEKPRIENWLTTYAGAEDNEFGRSLFRTALVKIFYFKNYVEWKWIA